MGKRKVSKNFEINDDQMNILLNFAARCNNICFGRVPPGLADIASREWRELARDMNYAYPENEQTLWKSPLQWKRYWSDLKTKTRAKVAFATHRSRCKKVSVKPNLKDYEQRILDLAEIASKVSLKKLSSVDSIDTESLSSDQPTVEQVVLTPTPEQRLSQSSGLTEAVASLAKAQADLAKGSHAIAEALLRLCERAK